MIAVVVVNVVVVVVVIVNVDAAVVAVAHVIKSFLAYSDVFVDEKVASVFFIKKINVYKKLKGGDVLQHFY